MRDFYIFDIPIYRWSPNQHRKALESAIEKRLYWVFDEHGLERPKGREYGGVETRAREGFGPWQFNDVVAWLRLYVQGHAIGGHFWCAAGKRLHRKTPKTYWLMSPSNALASYLPRNATNATIFEVTLKAIKNVKRRKGWTRRHFDLSVFERLGPFVNWRDLFQQEADETAATHEKRRGSKRAQVKR